MSIENVEFKEHLSLADQVTLAMIAHENEGELRSLALAILKEGRQRPTPSLDEIERVHIETICAAPMSKRPFGDGLKPVTYHGEAGGGSSTEKIGQESCEPPAEYCEKQWHWLEFSAGSSGVAKWSKGLKIWTTFGGVDVAPQNAVNMGWRYIGPCTLLVENEDGAS